MIRNMTRGIPSLFKKGTTTLTGVTEALLGNIEACTKLANLTRTSMGPNGMNKLIVNYLGKIFVTSDSATIMKELEMQHPAAKLLVMAASMQEQEIGDGSNFVVCFAGELLSKAEELVRMGLHPSQIIKGYEIAQEKALKLLEDLVIWKVSKEDLAKPEVVERAVYAGISSKQLGREEVLSKLVAKACMNVMPANPYNFNVDNVRVVKVLGRNLDESSVVKGFIVPRDTVGTIRSVENANVAVFTCSIEAPETESKGTVCLRSAEELLSYSENEEKAIHGYIKAIHDSGVNVVVTHGSVDDMALHYLEKYKIMVLKMMSKFQTRRLCRALKARPLVQLGAVRPEHQGFCAKVSVQEVGDSYLTVFSQDEQETCTVSTILLRSSTENTLNDVERATDDGVNIVRTMARDGRFLAGAGASDIELARLLVKFGAEQDGLEQYAIERFGQALEVVPRTLAENAGMDPIDTIGELYQAHRTSSGLGGVFSKKGESKTASGRNVGIRVSDGKLADMSDKILDLLATKAQAMRLAVDAALTVLRVNQIIMAKPAGGPKAPQSQGHWDDDD